MVSSAIHIPYQDTGLFSGLILDYLQGNGSVRPFYSHKPDKEGIQEAIHQRNFFPIHRSILSDHLVRQYEEAGLSGSMQEQIMLLRQPDTFTVTAAHQPNLFGGPLFFIYKILHAISLAKELNLEFPDKHFVPVYYMGNEDADLEELGHCTIMGTSYRWKTDQTGAFGKMKVDGALLMLLDEITARLGVSPFGEHAMQILRSCYTEGRTIEEATFLFVHTLFSEWGLLVLIPDSKELKALFRPIVQEELFQQTSGPIVSETILRLQQGYSIQTGVRDINLFYLRDNRRERIERNGDRWKVLNTSWVFTEAELRHEIETYPERFSPNVVLRPLYQELILPNVVFVGGGGELAYWLELNALFHHHQVSYPALLLRNSFLLSRESTLQKVGSLGFSPADLFRPTSVLLHEFVSRSSSLDLTVSQEITQLSEVYHLLQRKAEQVDITLISHVESLQKQAVKRVEALRKKMERAERRRYTEQRGRIEKIREEWFPGGQLQERTESLWTFYATHGPLFLENMLTHSYAMRMEWTIVKVHQSN